MAWTHWGNPPLPVGHRVLGRWDPALTTRRSAAVHIIRLSRRCRRRTRTQFIIARRISLLRFAYAAMMEEPLTVLPLQPTRHNAAGSMVTLRSHRTERFIFEITAVLGLEPF